MNGFLDFISSVEEVKTIMEKLINEYKGKEFYIKDKMTALDAEFYNLRTLPEMEETIGTTGWRKTCLLQSEIYGLNSKLSWWRSKKAQNRLVFLWLLPDQGHHQRKPKTH